MTSAAKDLPDIGITLRLLEVRFDTVDRHLEALAIARRRRSRVLMAAMLAGFGATIAGFTAVSGALAVGFGWL